MSKLFNSGLTCLLIFGFFGIALGQANILDSQPDDSKLPYSVGKNVTHTTQEKTFTTKNTVSSEPSGGSDVPVINIFITPYGSNAPAIIPPPITPLPAMPFPQMPMTLGPMSQTQLPEPVQQSAQPPQAILFIPTDPNLQPIQFVPEQPPMMMQMQQPMMMPQQQMMMQMQQPMMMQMQQPMMMPQQQMMMPMMQQPCCFGGNQFKNMHNGFQPIANDPYRATGMQPSVVAPAMVVYPNGVMVKPKVYLPGRFCHNFFQAITP